MSISETDLELKKIRDPEMLRRIGELRVRAWSTEAAIPPGTTCWLDEHDEGAHHWAFLYQGRLAAAARLTVHSTLEEAPDAEVYAGVFATPPPAPIGSLNRLVVHPEFRGLGLSRRLDEIRLAAAEQMGCRSLIGATRQEGPRIRQLQSLGFVIVGTGNPPEGHLAGRPVPVVLVRIASPTPPG